MSNRIKVLVFSDWYRPGFKGGGPINSIHGFVDNLRGDLDISIVTSSKDLGNKNDYPNIILNEWTKTNEGDRIIYIKTYFKSIFKVLLQERPDVCYFNSFFSFKFSIFPQIILKILPFKGSVLIAPRGEFLPERIRLKQIKKQVFISITRRLNIYSNVIWHATALRENEAILKIFKESNIFFASNLRARSNIRENFGRKGSVLKIVYVSRIVPYKNLNLALEICEKVQYGITLDIYGTTEDKEYFLRCEPIIKRNKHIKFCGALQSNVINTLCNYDLFLFPTQGENYGHIIVEAMMAGCITVISNKTPWTDIEEHGIGSVVDVNDLDGYIKQVKYWRDKSHVDFKDSQIKIGNYIKSRVFDEKQVDRYKILFSDLGVSD